MGFLISVRVFLLSAFKLVTDPTKYTLLLVTCSFFATLSFGSLAHAAPEIQVSQAGDSYASNLGFNSADPSTFVSFGQVSNNGIIVDRVFTIENTGTDPLILGANAVSIFLGGGTPYTVIVQPAATIAPGQSSDFTIRYTSIPGGFGTNVLINSNDADENPYAINVLGVGLPNLPEINVVGNGTNIVDGDTTASAADHTDFGSADISAGTVTRTFTIDNQGTAALTITNAALSGPDSGQFSITTPPAGAVAAAGSTTVVVQFDPSSLGAKSATLTITSDDNDEATYNFALAGTGTGLPEINVVGNGTNIVDGDTTPSAADHTNFGNAGITGGAVSRTFTIQNTGTDVLTITNAALSGANANQFSITTQPAGTVAAAGSTTVVVQFIPSALGTQVATLTINSDDGDEAIYDFLLTGIGIGAAEINVVGNGVDIIDGDTTPTSTDHTEFGSTDFTSGTISRTFTIQNIGSDLLFVTSAALSGVDANQFSITTQPAGMVAVGGSTTVVVQFDPSSSGAKSATLTINSSDSDESVYNFSINGTGTGNAEIKIVGNGVNIIDGDTSPSVTDHTDFGSVNITSGTLTRTFTIQNVGTDTLAIASANLSGVNAGQFAITRLPANTIAPSGSTTIAVQFDPSSSGAKTAILTINSDDADETVYNFVIGGTGTGTGSVKLVVNSVGGDTTVGFSSPTPALAQTISTASGAGTVAITGLVPGVHVVSANDLAASGFGITALSCDDDNSAADIATRTATINLAAGEVVTCAFTILETRDATGKLITNYLGARNSLIMANQPNRSRKINRLKAGNDGSSNGEISAFGLNIKNPVPLDASLNANVLSYATSYNRLNNTSNAFGRFDEENYTASKWDFWVEGKFSLYDAPSDDGNFSIAYTGIEYLLSSNALIGIMGQFDWIEHNFDTPGARASGQGWMIGPYATFKLNENFYLDLRGAWGRSTNKIKPFGTYEDTFTTTRWLTSGALSGDFEVNDWTFSPELEWSYISETQDAYTDSLNVSIPSRTVAQGKISIGPSLSRDFVLQDDKILTFSTKFQGDYAFGDSNNFSTGTLAEELQGLTGTAGMGIDIRNRSGVKLSLAGEIGGIGSNANVYQATVNLSIPLR